MPDTNELRLFISSTFRDLQEEREHLVKKIFPKIRSLCRERSITFTEVDLRWGITDEEVVLGQVIRACLEEVDRCRPYFIGITGERYGFVPDLVDIYKDAELLTRYPWIEEAAIEGSSIMDLEFRHGALNDVEASRSCARFFFRRERKGLEDPGYEGDSAEEDENRQLRNLQDRVRNAGFDVETFSHPAALGDLVHDELIEIIRRDFADAKQPTPLERERARHTAFSVSRRHAYIPNATYLRDVEEWFDSTDNDPLVIHAESGSGKSSLVSFWCERLRHSNPDLFIIEHYVGIGAGDADHLGLIRHVMEEIRERFDRSEKIPDKPQDLERNFANWLGFGIGLQILLVIDGINQLGSRALELHWLPPEMPEGMNLIITTTIGETLDELRKRGWRELGIRPLSEREREAVTVRFLSEYRKGLSAEQVRCISTDAKCAHPLFLRTLLEELRVESRHETIDQDIDRLLSTTGTEDLFQRVLERIEDDYGTRAVREVFSAIDSSRYGLTEEDLTTITGVSRLKLSTMLGGLDYHLVRKGDTLSFFHDYLRRAVEKRYVSDIGVRRVWWQRLADYFADLPIDDRSTVELLGALEKLGDRSVLEHALAETERFAVLWEQESDEILRLWSSTDADQVVAACDSALRGWVEKVDEERQLKVMSSLASLYETISEWSAAEALQLRRLEIARRVADVAQEARTLVSLSYLTRRQTRLDEAEVYSREAERLGRELGDRRLIADAIGSLGLVYAQRDAHADALKCFAQQESISRESGFRDGISRAISNSVHVHLGRDDLAEAQTCVREQESIAREIGDRMGIAGALGNRGLIHFESNELTEALACFVEKEAMVRQLGARDKLTWSVGCQGIVHAERHAHEQALRCFRKAAEEADSLGDRMGRCAWLYNLAITLLDVVSSAPEDAPMPDFMVPLLPDVEDPTWREATLRVARARAEESLTIYQESLNSRGSFGVRILLARITAAEGDVEKGCAELRALFDDASDDQQRASLHYQLWKHGSSAEENRAEAIRLYRALHEASPIPKYALWIDRLENDTREGR